MAFTAGSTKNGAIGGYGVNSEATVTNVTIKNVTNNGNALLEHVAEVNGTYYFNLTSAIEVAAAGKTVTLLRNVTETKVVTVAENADVVLNLNGKTVSLPQLMIKSGATVEVKDGSLVGTSADKDTVRSEGGNLTLTDVNVSGLRHTVRIISGTATINGGNYTYGGNTTVYKTLHIINVGDDEAPTTNVANVTIKAGTFVAGKPYTYDGGCAVKVQKGSTVTIEGGEFSNGVLKTLDADDGATLSITGGSYDRDPSAYVAEGYIAKEVDGIYTVVTAPAIEVTYADGTVEYFDDMSEAIPYKTNYDKLQGATIKLMDDVTAKGIRFMETDMVLDLNGHTYTINDATGSSGTNTSGFQIREDAANATIKNGTIKVADAADMVNNPNVIWMFNSYSANLTVENVTIDCANMAYSYGESVYTHVSRPGDNTNFTGTTQFINFNTETAGNAMNVGGTMTIGDDVIPGGSIELDAGATLTAPEGLDVVTVDGYSVAYNNGVYTTVQSVAKIGDTYYATLADAFKAAADGETVTIITSGTYKLPAFSKELTIKAAEGLDVVIDNGGAVALHGAKATFENLTFDYYPNVNYTGLQHIDTAVYNNCTFNGQVFLYGNSETFNNCTFNQDSADAYNVWTYGAKNVTFNECTFNSAGKSVLVYNEGATANNVTVTGSTFNASQAVEGKAAIEIDTSLIAADKGDTVITITNSEANGFAAGSVSGNSLWNDKKDKTNLSVYVENAKVWPIPELPTATVTELENEDLTFALNFKADEAAEEQLAYYGKWYADFVLTVNKDVTFNANGDADGYLSGQYDAWSENWVNVPFENVTLTAGQSLKIMEYAAQLMGEPGLKLTYNDVYGFVKNFNCGIFFEPEFLAANPDFVVTLELRMYNPEDESESYVIGETYEFEAPKIVAENVGTGAVYATAAEALMAAKSGETVRMLTNTDEMMIVVFDGITFDLNGYQVSAQYVTSYGDIVDNSESNAGLLVVAKNRFMIREDNAQVPSVSDSGYKFIEIIDFKIMTENGGAKLIFQPWFEDYASMLFQDQAAWESSGLTISVVVSWEANGMPQQQKFIYTPAHVMDVFVSYRGDNAGYNQAYNLILKNIDGLESLTMTAMVESETGVVVSCQP